MGKRGRRANQVLRIRAEEDLPDYKRAVSLDDLDRAILEAHQEDACCYYRELAEKRGVTETTVRNRIRRMKASGVMDLVLVMNPYKTGYPTFTISGVKLRDDASSDEVASDLLAIPGLSSVVMVTGRFDLFAWYVCRDLEEYRRFATEQLREVPGVGAIESFGGLDLYDAKFQLGVIGEGFLPPRPDLDSFSVLSVLTPSLGTNRWGGNIPELHKQERAGPD